MPARTITPRNRIWQGSNTATTGGSIILSVAATEPGAFNFRDRYVNGATDVALYLYDGDTGVFEYSYGTLTYGASVVLDTISARVIDESSNGSGIPVAWGAGTRNALCLTAPESFLLRHNSLSELTDPQAALALTRLGVVFGTAAGNVNALDGSGRHALSTLPLGLGIVSSSTGGSNNKIVRVSGSGTVTNASRTDTNAQLRTVMCKGSDGIVYYPGREVPFTGAVAGSSYFLHTSGDITTTPPTVDAGTGVKSLPVGFSPATDILYFDPGPLTTYDDGFSPVPVPLNFKAGLFQV